MKKVNIKQLIPVDFLLNGIWYYKEDGIEILRKKIRFLAVIEENEEGESRDSIVPVTSLVEGWNDGRWWDEIYDVDNPDSNFLGFEIEKETKDEDWVATIEAIEEIEKNKKNEIHPTRK